MRSTNAPGVMAVAWQGRVRSVSGQLTRLFFHHGPVRPWYEPCLTHGSYLVFGGPLVRTAMLALLLGCGCGPRADTSGSAGAVEVSATQLWQDYRGNVAAADEKYLNKTLRVTGRVLSEYIEQSPNGYAVGLETGPHIMIDGRVLKAGVVAECPISERTAVGKLKDFDEITIVGRCVGMKTAPSRMGGIKVTLASATIAAHTPRKH